MTVEAPLGNYTSEVVRSLGGPDWLQAARLEALARVDGAEPPREAEEVWRYSRIDDLDLDSYDPAPGSAPGGPATAEEARSALAAAVGPDASSLPWAGLVLVDHPGRISVSLSPEAEKAGLRVSPAADGDEALLGAVAGEGDFVVDLATAFAATPLVVDVPRGAVVEAPLLVVNRLPDGARALFPRTLVRLGEASQASVVEVVAGGAGGLSGPVVELSVGDAAVCSYVGLQRLGDGAWQLGHHTSSVGRDATLRSFVVALGGYYARLRTDSRLVGEGGSSNLMALYFGAADQMHDFRTLQDHRAPRTTSDLLFKGAVKDEARGVYSGLIRVRRGASGTNAFQTNRNLVLSEGAHAESVPNLEIEDNDVRCSHASAVGPVDAEQRYYLESRGVPPEVADRLIVLGFFDDLLGRCPVAGLREPLRRLVTDKLLAPAAPPVGVA